jgi:hypothetical protein
VDVGYRPYVAARQHRTLEHHVDKSATVSLMSCGDDMIAYQLRFCLPVGGPDAYDVGFLRDENQILTLCRCCLIAFEEYDVSCRISCFIGVCDVRVACSKCD